MSAGGASREAGRSEDVVSKWMDWTCNRKNKTKNKICTPKDIWGEHLAQSEKMRRVGEEVPTRT